MGAGSFQFKLTLHATWGLSSCHFLTANIVWDKCSQCNLPNKYHACPLVRANFTQYLGRFLGIISQNSSVSKFNWLDVEIFRIVVTNLICMLQIPLKWLVIFLKSWTSTGHFSSWTGSSVTSSRFSPFIKIKHKLSTRLYTNIKPISKVQQRVAVMMEIHHSEKLLFSRKSNAIQ